MEKTEQTKVMNTSKQIEDLAHDLSLVLALNFKVKSEVVQLGVEEEIKRICTIMHTNLNDIELSLNKEDK